MLSGGIDFLFCYNLKGNGWLRQIEKAFSWGTDEQEFNF